MLTAVPRLLFVKALGQNSGGHAAGQLWTALIKYSAQDWETFGLRDNCAIRRQTVCCDQAPCEQLSKRSQFFF
jgi:hypothetical protein